MKKIVFFGVYSACCLGGEIFGANSAPVEQNLSTGGGSLPSTVAVNMPQAMEIAPSASPTQAQSSGKRSYDNTNQNNNVTVSMEAGTPPSKKQQLSTSVPSDSNLGQDAVGQSQPAGPAVQNETFKIQVPDNDNWLPCDESTPLPGNICALDIRDLSLPKAISALQSPMFPFIKRLFIGWREYSPQLICDLLNITLNIMLNNHNLIYLMVDDRAKYMREAECATFIEAIKYIYVERPAFKVNFRFPAIGKDANMAVEQGLQDIQAPLIAAHISRTENIRLENDIDDSLYGDASSSTERILDDLRQISDNNARQMICDQEVAEISQQMSNALEDTQKAREAETLNHLNALLSLQSAYQAHIQNMDRQILEAKQRINQYGSERYNYKLALKKLAAPVNAPAQTPIRGQQGPVYTVVTPSNTNAPAQTPIRGQQGPVYTVVTPSNTIESNITVGQSLSKSKSKKH